MSARDLLHKFANVRRSGDGWTARCPAHDDERNSLSVGKGGGGRVLIHCHAGCSFEAVCAAASISGGVASQIVAAYDYLDETHALLYQSVRLNPKGFFQRKPDGAGWAYRLNGVRRVPYRLPELLAADPRERIYIPEGEKDVERLASLGFVATTNAGGAGKWRDEYSEHLRGRHVAVIPDNDDPGRKHAAQVARSLCGIAASIRILELPDLPPKGDVSNWLDAGGTPEQLRALAESAPEWKPQGKDEPTPKVVCMADVAPEEVRWLSHPYIPLGKLTIIEGDPGLGKSWMLCALAAAVTRGRGLPGTDPFEPGAVLMLTAEDGLADTLRPRLDKLGADVARVMALAVPMTFDAAGLLELEEMIAEHSPLLVTIDPLFAYTGGKMDINKANESRAVTSQLAAIAERRGCAILAVRHLGKARGGGHALNAGIGSIDFTAAARSILLVGQDPDEPAKRALVHTKSNLAPVGESVGYSIEDGKFYWTGPSDLTAERILAAPSGEEERGSISDAVDFLKTALCNGKRDSKAVEADARQAGIKPATLNRAKRRLGVRSHKVGMPGSHYQKWVWELPGDEDDQTPAEGDQVSRTDHLRANAEGKSIYGNNLPEDDQLSSSDHLRSEADHLRAGNHIAEDAALTECLDFFSEVAREEGGRLQ